MVRQRFTGSRGDARVAAATTDPNYMPDQSRKPRPMPPTGPSGGGEGPNSPQVDKPNVDDLLKRMRKVDPDQARRYRQRTGQ
jgi:hypothetical protein